MTPEGWAQPQGRLERGHYFVGFESLCRHRARKPEVILTKYEPRSPCWKCVVALGKRKGAKK